MTAKTRNFNELRDQARRRDPGWDEQVAERRRAMQDALALGGHLEIAAVFDDERYPVAPGCDPTPIAGYTRPGDKGA